MQATSYPWIQKIEEHLAALDQKPQFGGETFPWGELEKKLRSLFQRPSLSLESFSLGWLDPKDLLKGIGEKPFIHQIFLSPLTTPLYWVISEQDVRFLLADLLGSEVAAAPFFEKDPIEAFEKYLALEILGQISELGFAKGLSARLGSGTNVDPSLPAFALEISLNAERLAVRGRLLIPASFRDEWKRFLAVREVKAPKKLDQLEKISLDLGMEVGNVSLSLGEWNKAKAGDFLLLDCCFYDPEHKTGRVLITLDEKPLFRGKIKDYKIQLLEYPLLEEGEASMSDDDEDEDFFEEDEEDLYGDLSEEEKEDEDQDFESLLRRASAKKEQEKEATHELEEEKTESKEAVSGQKVTLSPEEISLKMTVEVGRIRLTAAQLMDLSPGSLIELPVTPEQGVDLLVNGRKVGRGELIKIGETLGVRILSL